MNRYVCVYVYVNIVCMCVCMYSNKMTEFFVKNVFDFILFLPCLFDVFIYVLMFVNSVFIEPVPVFYYYLYY